MLNAIIVDDERRGRETLQSLLRKYCPNVQVVSTADSVATGVEAIDRHHPDLLFLDIEMPFGNGFDLLEKAEGTGFEVIFTTAYNQYAIRAIRSNALDYLLKPIDRDELVAAVDRAATKIAAGTRTSASLQVLIDNLKHAGGDQRIALPTDEGLSLVVVQDIIRCEADGNYTRFYFRGGETMLVSRTLKEFEGLLGDMNFIRVHHSYLINLRHVKKYLRGDGGELIMSDNSTILVSRRKKEEVVKRLKGFSIYD